MPTFKVTYTRVFDYEMDADSLDQAHARAKNFAIGMSKNMNSAVKILSVISAGYVEPVAPAANPTFYERLVGGMREKIDTLLE